MTKDDKHSSGIPRSTLNGQSKKLLAKVAKITSSPTMEQVKDFKDVQVAVAGIDQNSMLRNKLRPLQELNKSLDYIDKEFLKDLRSRTEDAVFDYKRDPDAYNKLQDDLDDALKKFIETIEEFELLNSEHERKLAFKEAELALDNKQLAAKLEAIEKENSIKAKYDWGEKWRHLFVKSLGTVLFISVLLLVGWLVKTYEWAELPYSSLFKTVVPIPR